MTHAPLLRGLFLSALARPVIVRPTDKAATLTLDANLETVDASTLSETELPVVVTVGEETD